MGRLKEPMHADASDPEVERWAKVLGRTPSAVAQKVMAVQQMDGGGNDRHELTLIIEDAPAEIGEQFGAAFAEHDERGGHKAELVMDGVRWAELRSVFEKIGEKQGPHLVVKWDSLGAEARLTIPATDDHTIGRLRFERAGWSTLVLATRDRVPVEAPAEEPA